MHAHQAPHHMHAHECVPHKHKHSNMYTHTYIYAFWKFWTSIRLNIMEWASNKNTSPSSCTTTQPAYMAQELPFPIRCEIVDSHPPKVTVPRHTGLPCLLPAYSRRVLGETLLGLELSDGSKTTFIANRPWLEAVLTCLKCLRNSPLSRFPLHLYCLLEELFMWQYHFTDWASNPRD